MSYSRQTAIAVYSSLIAPYTLWKINRGLAAKIVDDSEISLLSDEALEKLVESEWTRAKELDDKLQKLTAALSVAVTVGGLVGTTMIQDLAASIWKFIAAGTFAVAVIFLVAGVVLGFNGLRPKPRYGYGAAFQNILAQGGSKARNELIAAAANFQRDNIVRSNEASAATESIRNGILVFVVAVLVGLGAAAFGKKSSPLDLPRPSTEFCLL